MRNWILSVLISIILSVIVGVILVGVVSMVVWIAWWTDRHKATVIITIVLAVLILMTRKIHELIWG